MLEQRSGIEQGRHPNGEIGRQNTVDLQLCFVGQFPAE